MTAKLRLGDAEIARIGLGTNRLAYTPTNVAFVKEAVAAGMGMIDTAHTYTNGQSEETIGAALSPDPDRCVIATKGLSASGTPSSLAIAPAGPKVITSLSCAPSAVASVAALGGGWLVAEVSQ